MFLAALLSLAACRKDKTENPDPTIPEPSALEYFPLKVGNWWKYDAMVLDTNDFVRMYDSSGIYCEVLDDSLMNGHLYFLLRSNDPNLYNTWCRDSLNLLVTLNGDIIFSACQSTFTFDKVVYDTLYTMDRIAEPGPYQISTPSGSFECIRNRNYLYDYDTTLFRYTPGFKDNLSAYYAKGIGRVFIEFAYASSDTKIRLLLSSYHIEP